MFEYRTKGSLRHHIADLFERLLSGIRRLTFDIFYKFPYPAGADMLAFSVSESRYLFEPDPSLRQEFFHTFIIRFCNRIKRLFSRKSSGDPERFRDVREYPDIQPCVGLDHDILILIVCDEQYLRIRIESESQILVAEDISAKPKSEIHEPFDGEKVYTILKLWKDDSSKQRPPYISVDILKDAELYETVTLDSENDWSYTFNTDSAGKWTVVERDVPEGYFVVITEKETSFIITNTLYNTNPDDGTPGKNTGTDTGTPGGSKPVTPGTNAPQTGDTFPMKRYMIMLCVSGMMLVVLGFGMRRKDDAKGR